MRLVTPADLRSIPKIEETLTEAGVPADEVEVVLAGVDEATWPAPFSGDQR